MHTYACNRFSLHFSLTCVFHLPFHFSGTCSLSLPLFVLSLFHTQSLSFSPPLVYLHFFLCLCLLSLSHCHCHTQTLKSLFLAGWVWKCVMINMLPWLLILSNGSVKLQCLDKYRRWRNICGAPQRHNEGKQLELIGYTSERAAVVFRRWSKASSILHLSAYPQKSQTTVWLTYQRLYAWNCTHVNHIWIFCRCPTIHISLGGRSEVGLYTTSTLLPRRHLCWLECSHFRKL